MSNFVVLILCIASLMVGFTIGSIIFILLTGNAILKELIRKGYLTIEEALRFKKEN